VSLPFAYVRLATKGGAGSGLTFDTFRDEVSIKRAQQATPKTPPSFAALRRRYFSGIAHRMCAIGSLEPWMANRTGPINIARVRVTAKWGRLFVGYLFLATQK